MPYKTIGRSYRTRGGIRYSAAEYGLTKEKAEEMVARYKADGTQTFKERDRYIGGGELYIVFADERCM